MNFKVKLSSLVLGFVAFATVASAQDYSDPQFAKYGSTPEQRKENVLKYNYLRDAYNAKQWEAAASYLKGLMETAPEVGQNLYIMGSTIYKNKIAKATTKEARKVFVDSLMVIYDARAKYFGDHATRGEAYILSEKAKDFLNYNPSETKPIKELVNKAIDAAGANVDLDLVQAYFNVLVQGYKRDMVETEALLNEYDYISNAVALSTDDIKADVQATIDQLFIQSGAATCENLELIFKPQFAATPNDAELAKKIARYLARNNCATPFGSVVAEKIYSVEPTSGAAIVIATGYAEAKDYTKAFKFFDEAISLEKDPATAANFAISAASNALMSNNARQAAEYARKAIANDANSGLGYFLLGQAYAQGSAGCSGFDRQTVYWLVVDNMNRARTLLPSDSPQLEAVNKSIGTYSASFPSAEEVFFRTLNVGSSYSVNCGWISGSTTIRERR